MQDILHRCNSASASYLFQPDKFYDVSYDTGDKSFQCGRKVDAFKLWLMWKARGDKGMEQIVDNAFDCARLANAFDYFCVLSLYQIVALLRYFAEKVNSRPGFRLVIPEVNCTNVCFWYIPPSLRNCEESSQWWDQISKVISFF